jgi:hypothetical protein
MNENKTVLVFSTYESRSNGYGHTHVVIYQAEALNIDALIEGCIDNKVGYGGGPEVAKVQEQRYRAMKAAGITETYSMVGSRLHIDLDWQHYNAAIEDYCDVCFAELGRRLEDVERAMKFLRQLGARIERAKARSKGREPYDVSHGSFKCPQDVLAALAKIKGAVETTFSREHCDTIAKSQASAEIAA